MPAEIATIGMAGPVYVRIRKGNLLKYHQKLTPTQDEKETSFIQFIAKYRDQIHVKHYPFTQHPTESRYE